MGTSSVNMFENNTDMYHGMANGEPLMFVEDFAYLVVSSGKTMEPKKTPKQDWEKPVYHENKVAGEWLKGTWQL